MAIVKNPIVSALPPALRFYREQVFRVTMKYKLYDRAVNALHFNTRGYDDREIDGTGDIWIRIYFEGEERLSKLSIHIEGGDLVESRIDNCSYAAYAKYKVYDLIQEWEKGKRWLL